MTIKTWTFTAASVVYGSVELWMGADNLLHVKRGYRFVDDEGREIFRFANQRWTYEEAIPWESVPTDVQDSLIFINNYTIGQINTIEGITSGSA